MNRNRFLYLILYYVAKIGISWFHSSIRAVCFALDIKMHKNSQRKYIWRWYQRILVRQPSLNSDSASWGDHPSKSAASQCMAFHRGVIGICRSEWTFAAYMYVVDPGAWQACWQGAEVNRQDSQVSSMIYIYIYRAAHPRGQSGWFAGLKSRIVDHNAEAELPA